MPTAAVPGSGFESSITPTPSMPSGGTALMSAATLSRLADLRVSDVTTCMPAAAQASSTSVSASAARQRRRVATGKPAQADAEAPAGRARGRFGRIDAAATRQQDLGAGACRDHAGDTAHRARAADNDDALPFQTVAVMAPQ